MGKISIVKFRGIEKCFRSFLAPWHTAGGSERHPSHATDDVSFTNEIRTHRLSFSPINDSRVARAACFLPLRLSFEFFRDIDPVRAHGRYNSISARRRNELEETKENRRIHPSISISIEKSKPRYLCWSSLERSRGFDSREERGHVVVVSREPVSERPVISAARSALSSLAGPGGNSIRERNEGEGGEVDDREETI